MSIGGFHSNFKNAEYYIQKSTLGPITIIDTNSEKNARLINTPSGWAGYGLPVHVYGGRFAVDQVSNDGKVINFQRRGPLTVTGLRLDGTPPSGVDPILHFNPPIATGGVKYSGQFVLTGTQFRNSGSNTYDPVSLGTDARLYSTGNMCTKTGGDSADCIGLAGGMDSKVGVTASELSGLSMLDGHTTYCTDCSQHTSPCQGGGAGATATRVNGTWDCGGGVVLSAENRHTQNLVSGQAGAINGTTYFKIGGATMSSGLGIPMIRSGSVTGVSCSTTVGVITTAGTVIVEALKNGSVVFTASTTVSTTGALTWSNTQAHGLSTFAADDQIELRVSFGTFDGSLGATIAALELSIDN